jgi:hypothetical protein
MSINNLRELLIKKASGNKELQGFIKIIREDYLIEHVIDSLAKMARPKAHKGSNANSALTTYAASLDNTDIAQLKDALSHHIAHHKAALRDGNRQAADQHLEKIIPLMDLAARARSISGGKLDFDYISTRPWETNYTQPDRHPHNGKLVEGTKGLGRRPAKKSDRQKNPRAVPDYRYLEMSPHEEHSDVEKMPHKGGYPFEEIQVGSPMDVDKKQAYLHIPEVKKKIEGFTPHEFDNHPIHAVHDTTQAELDKNPQIMQNFSDSLTSWRASPHHDSWKTRHKQEFAGDSEGYKNRGKVKPDHHFKDMKLLTQPHKESSAQASAPPAAAATATAQPSAQPKTQPPSPSVDFSQLPPELRQKYGK